MALAGTLLVASLSALLTLYVNKYRNEDFEKAFVNDPPDLNLPVKETYDFIIVGGGGAGCVVARRLSDAKFTVLVLEAGGDPPPLSNIPLIFYLDVPVPYNYLAQYIPIPQKNISASLIGYSGRVIGGGTTVSGLIYERGNPRDFEQWSEITGDPSWHYKNVLKYFKKQEDYMGKFPITGQHGQNGPVGIEQPDFHPVQEEFLQAGKELGFDVVDPNGPNRIGFSPENIQTRNGRRQSTYLAYIKPIEKTQKYLTIYRYSAVSRVLFDGKTAIGVEYKRHGIPRVAFANKEVILSTGPYMTPILLIQSGIGPEDQLKAANAEPISIRPVGENFMNHLAIPIQVKVEPSKSWEINQNLTFADVDLFLKQGEGPLGAGDQVAYAYLASERAKKDGEPNWPDLHITYSFVDLVSTTKPYGNFLVSVARPKSRGRITYNSSATDILDPYITIVDPMYFSDPSDFKVVLEGFAFCQKITRTKAFRQIGAEMFPGPKPRPCQKFNKNSQRYWACRIRQDAATFQNVGGTARMGRVNDPGAVVGPNLKVIGVEGLRVVDSSVIPTLTGGQPTAPTIMIAEKISAEMIQEYANFKSNSNSRSTILKQL